VLAAAIVTTLIARQAAIFPSAGSGPLATPSPPEGAPFIALQTPRPVASLSFTSGDDAPLTLADFHGRMVLLNLWATWCVPCREEMPALDRLQAKLGGPSFTVVPLSIDHRGRSAVEHFYRELGVKSLSIYVDKSASAIYAVNAVGMPTTLLIDAQGRELGRVIGPAEWDGRAMLSQLARYLKVADRGARGDPHAN
jgi:thiol-disulfide isomerase/thioredoxin